MQSLISNTIFLMQNTLVQSRKSGMRTLNVPTSSLSEALARILASPEKAKASKDGKATLSAMPLKLSDGSDLTFLSGRTLRESSSQDIARIFGALSKPLPTLGVIDSNGNCLIHHGFYPRTGKGYTLWDVLQKDVPQEYFLSCRRVEGLLHSIMMHPLFVLSER